MIGNRTLSNGMFQSLGVNVMYTVDDLKKRAVGFKLSEGMEVPKELEEKFKFVRQKSKLAGTYPGHVFRH